MTTDSFTQALERLDPASRALLDLSLRRGMRTEEIADLLGADPASVEENRDEALRRVAEDVGMDSDTQLDEVRARLAELPAEEWLGRTRVAGADGAATEEVAGDEVAIEEEPAAETPDEAEAEAPAEPEPEPEPAAVADQPEREPTRSPITPGARRRGRVWPWLLLALVGAAAVAVIVLAAGGGGDDEESPPPRPAETPARKAPAGGEGRAGVALTKLGAAAAGARGTARVSRGRLELTIRGLGKPRGAYEVWLYSSVIEAERLGASKRGNFEVESKLPGNWRRFRFVDVSLEPPDDNPSHSGQSVLRVPTRKLAAGAG